MHTIIPREASGDGVNFGLQQVLGDRKLSNARDVVTIDNNLHDEDSPLKCIYSTEKQQVGQELKIANKNGKAVFLSVPPAGFVIFG